MSPEEKAHNEEPKRGINPTLLASIIGAVATILAAVIPAIIIINANKPAPAPSITPRPTVLVVTATDLPSPTSTSTPQPTETPAVTSTPIPPSATPTTPVGLYDVYLAQDRAGQSKTTVFGPQQSVFIFFKVNDPSGSNTVRVVWYAVDVQGFPTNTFLSSDEGVISRSPFSYEMLYSPRWKVGKYKVELYLNGSLAATEEFEVK